MDVSNFAPLDQASVQRIAVEAHLDLDPQADFALPWSRVLVARDEHGDVVAFLHAWLVADELQVLHVATEPKRRRRGAARALVASLIDLGRLEHSSRLILEVRRSNEPAITLYRSAGFRAIRVRRGYYAGDGEDAIEMMLTLDPETGAVCVEPDEISVGGAP